MNKYLTEFIGTFFLVLAIGMNVLSPSSAEMAPLAIGAALMVLVYAGGHISGAHYNPAVTLAVFMRGKCDAKDVAPYMVSQVLGASAAALLAVYLKGNPIVTAASPDIMRAFIAEFVWTFALAYVVLNTATAKGTTGGSFYGLAVGFTVVAGAYAMGGISGAVFNPAVAVGVSIMGGSAWANIWIFIVANFGGAALAATVFKIFNADYK
jgi:aquaporin Z